MGETRQAEAGCGGARLPGGHGSPLRGRQRGLRGAGWPDAGSWGDVRQEAGAGGQRRSMREGLRQGCEIEDGTRPTGMRFWEAQGGAAEDPRLLEGGTLGTRRAPEPPDLCPLRPRKRESPS